MTVSVNQLMGAAVVGAGDIALVQWDKNRAITEPTQQFQFWGPPIAAGVAIFLGTSRMGGPMIREVADAVALGALSIAVSRIGGVMLQSAGVTTPSVARSAGMLSARPAMSIPARAASYPSSVVGAVHKTPTGILRA